MEEFEELLINCGFDIEKIIRYDYEGIHMLAIARPKYNWQPSDRIKNLINKQYPDFEPLCTSQKIQALEKEITFMKNSKFWKLRKKYINAKSKLTKLLS